MVSEVTRNIQAAVTAQLWGRAAGRCEFLGCNRPLWKSDVTQEQVNVAEKAHIWAFSDQGPRGNKGVSPGMLNDISNLMLVCHGCHKLIDADKKGEKYSAEYLKNIKVLHEQRVERVTGIASEMKSHILMYGANIGGQSSHLNYKEAATAMFPGRYPAEDRPIALGVKNSPVTDNNERYWELEKNFLEEQFKNLVKPQLIDGAIHHLSIFGLAPQPLLILLGSMLSDIPAADVYQLHREPKTWRWNNASTPLEFEITEPQKKSNNVALILSISASVTDERIHKVFGDDVSLWKITHRNPNNDCIQSSEDLARFRKIIRELYNKIKMIHGGDKVIHLFPAVPVSCAIEIGRVRMPKADMKLELYDEVNERGGFIRAFSIDN